MGNEKLEQLILKEKEHLAKLQEKRTKIEQEIKKCTDSLEKYSMLQNIEKYKAFEKTLRETGISTDELFTALQSGDFLTLQKRLAK